MTQSNPPCCREVWPAATTLTQTSMVDPQVYSEDDIRVRVGGQVTFTFIGFENVEQVGDFVSFVPAASGIRSGDPVNGGTFAHTFNTAGTYYFSSYVHQTLRVKVTVMDCVSCITVVGYDGADLSTLVRAMSSRAPG